MKPGVEYIGSFRWLSVRGRLKPVSYWKHWQRVFETQHTLQQNNIASACARPEYILENPIGNYSKGFLPLHCSELCDFGSSYMLPLRVFSFDRQASALAVGLSCRRSTCLASWEIDISRNRLILFLESLKVFLSTIGKIPSVLTRHWQESRHPRYRR